MIRNTGQFPSFTTSNSKYRNHAGKSQAQRCSYRHGKRLASRRISIFKTLRRNIRPV